MSTPAAALQAFVPSTIVAFAGLILRTIGTFCPKTRERKFVISSAANCTGPGAFGAIATCVFFGVNSSAAASYADAALSPLSKLHRGLDSL